MSDSVYGLKHSAPVQTVVGMRLDVTDGHPHELLGVDTPDTVVPSFLDSSDDDEWDGDQQSLDCSPGPVGPTPPHPTVPAEILAMFGIEGDGGSAQGSAAGAAMAQLGGEAACLPVAAAASGGSAALRAEQEEQQEQKQELKSEHVEEEAAEEAGQVLAPPAAATEVVATAGPTVQLGGRRMPAFCPACGAPAISPEQYAFLKDPKNVTGRRDTRNPDDPRNFPENALTTDFLVLHIITQGMTLRDICFYHGHSSFTVTRTMQDYQIPNPRNRSKNKLGPDEVPPHRRKRPSNKRSASAKRAAAGGQASPSSKKSKGSKKK